MKRLLSHRWLGLACFLALAALSDLLAAESLPQAIARAEKDLEERRHQLDDVYRRIAAEKQRLAKERGPSARPRNSGWGRPGRPDARRTAPPTTG